MHGDGRDSRYRESGQLFNSFKEERGHGLCHILLGPCSVSYISVYIFLV
jgi:hypothetical protein